MPSKPDPKQPPPPRAKPATSTRARAGAPAQPATPTAAPPASAPALPARRFGPGNGLGAYRSKIRELLSEADLAAFDRLLETPRLGTIEKATAWVQARGYPIGRGAVIAYKRAFQLRLKETRRAAHVAHHFALLARHSGVTFSDAIIGAMQQVLMEYLVQTDAAKHIDPKDLPGLVKSVEAAVRTGRLVTARDDDAHADARPAAIVVTSRVVDPADATDRPITAAERDAALESVVDRVNEYLLGVDEQNAAEASLLPAQPSPLPVSPPASAPPLPPACGERSRSGEGRGEGERREPLFLEGPEQETAEIAKSAERSAEDRKAESPQMDTDSHG